MKLERTLRAGESFTDVLVVDNSGASEAKRFEIKIVDWSLDSKGDLIYTEPGEIKESLAKNIVCSPMQFRCAPGERKLIRYTLSLPASVGPGEHTLGIQALEVIIPPKDANTGKINVGVAVKCGFLCAMSIITPKIEAKTIEPLSLAYEAAKEKQEPSIELCIRNDGNSRVRPKWSFEITNESNQAVFEENAKDYLVLRQSQRTISCPVKKDLKPGKYKVQGKLDQGIPYPLQALEKEFEVSKAELHQDADEAKH